MRRSIASGSTLDNAGSDLASKGPFAFCRLSWREAQKLIHREEQFGMRSVNSAYALPPGLEARPSAPFDQPLLVRLRARSFGRHRAAPAGSRPGADPTDLGAASNSCRRDQSDALFPLGRREGCQQL